MKKKLDIAKTYMVEHIKTIAASVEPIYSYLSSEEIISYWRGISYDLSEEHKKGLECFRRYAKEIGRL
ncbi:MAG: hypothetical protein D6828_05825 [Nitrospirae bacterium]|nr:MAG: hypothetical protein D6828_05825 [Nitrospirota bacterium]